MNNKYPQITFIFDRRKTATPTTQSYVEMRITHQYKQKYISTGIKLYSTQWKNGKIVNCPDIIKVSQILDKMLSNVRQVILDMMEEGHIDIKSIPKRLDGMTTEKITFKSFCKQRAIIRKFGKQEDTQERYDRFLKMFFKWGGIKDFDDITDKNIIAYDKYLTSKGMKRYSIWNNYHRFLNSFIIDAIDEGYIRRNPYKWINIDKNKTSGGLGKYLSPEEYNTLKGAKMPTESLERVKDVFIFQTYTCLAYADLHAFYFYD